MQRIGPRGIKAGAHDDAFSMQRRAENEKARVDELERKMGSLARAIHDAEELSIGLANAVENTDLANDVMQRTQQFIAVIRQASTRILATDIGKMEAQELEERNREQEMEILNLRRLWLAAKSNSLNIAIHRSMKKKKKEKKKKNVWDRQAARVDEADRTSFWLWRGASHKG